MFVVTTYLQVQNKQYAVVADIKRILHEVFVCSKTMVSSAFYGFQMEI